eukprot:1158836-Pelagomonas_calceolata.AAC.5
MRAAFHFPEARAEKGRARFFPVHTTPSARHTNATAGTLCKSQQCLPFPGGCTAFGELCNSKLHPHLLHQVAWQPFNHCQPSFYNPQPELGRPQSTFLKHHNLSGCMAALKSPCTCNPSSWTSFYLRLLCKFTASLPTPTHRPGFPRGCGPKIWRTQSLWPARMHASMTVSAQIMKQYIGYKERGEACSWLDKQA